MSRPCGCPEEKRPGIGDDDRFKKWIFPSLIEAQTSTDFTISIKVSAIGAQSLIESILDDFDSYKHEPHSDREIRRLEKELDEIVEALANIRDDTELHVSNLDWEDILRPLDCELLDIDIDIDVQ